MSVSTCFNPLNVSKSLAPRARALHAVPSRVASLRRSNGHLRVRASTGDSLKDMASKVGKKVSGNDEYEFGDLTKKAASAAKNLGNDMKEAVTDFGKEMTGDNDYEVGDASKAVLKRAEEDIDKSVAAAEAAGKKLLEDEDYKLGDLTKGAIKSAKKAMGSSSSEE
mmetsp:Transcript_33501/g.64162  ORF Transcript_33501/g.64162 Transcript_33501/m.64162 type:complete len:166 (-) Transcript_33501:10-507(-)